MATIGNTVTSVPFIADSFSGNASTTSFSPLTRAPAGTAAIAVFIAGVYQAPGTYTLSGVTITFASAPASGVGNIIVLHLGNGSATQVPSDGSVTTIKLSNDTYGYINAAFTSANAAFATANTGTASGSYANSAFATANTGTAAGSYANSAFATANTGTASGSYANSAFATANTGSASGSYANSAFSVANTSSTNATNAGVYANSAFATANTGSASGSYANSAFAKANTAGTGTVTSVATGNGLSGGTITTTGTLVIGCPAWLSVGSYATLWHMSTGTVGAGDTASGSNLKYNISDGNASNAGDFGANYTSNSGGTATSGTWRHMGSGRTGDPCGPRYYVGLWCRVS